MPWLVMVLLASLLNVLRPLGRDATFAPSTVIFPELTRPKVPQREWRILLSVLLATN